MTSLFLRVVRVDVRAVGTCHRRGTSRPAGLFQNACAPPIVFLLLWVSCVRGVVVPAPAGGALFRAIGAVSTCPSVPSLGIVYPLRSSHRRSTRGSLDASRNTFKMAVLAPPMGVFSPPSLSRGLSHPDGSSGRRGTFTFNRCSRDVPLLRTHPSCCFGAYYIQIGAVGRPLGLRHLPGQLWPSRSLDGTPSKSPSFWCCGWYTASCGSFAWRGT